MGKQGSQIAQRYFGHKGRGLEGGAYLLDSCRLAGRSGSALMLPPSSSAPRTGARSRGTPVRGRPGNHWPARLPRLAASAALSTRPSRHPGPPPAEELRRLHIRSNRKCLVFSILSADVHYVEMKSTRIFVRACPSPCITVISIYRGDGVKGEVTTGD